jgi:hypothetical protein
MLYDQCSLFHIQVAIPDKYHGNVSTPTLNFLKLPSKLPLYVRNYDLMNGSNFSVLLHVGDAAIVWVKHSSECALACF